jgi:hypothetical protein
MIQGTAGLPVAGLLAWWVPGEGFLNLDICDKGQHCPLMTNKGERNKK